MRFWRAAGKLPGFIGSSRGIEENPAKIRALSQLAIPTDLKQIQKLTGCVAALSRFISQLGEKALPLYRLLRCTEHFEWTDAATAGLEEIKAILATNPILAAPNVGATYQRMIQTFLEKQIGKTVEANVDDVVVKTRHVESLIDDLRLMFDNLRTYDIKLNPEKCVFGVPAGKLLGSSSPVEELKQIRLKSELCHSWLSQQTSSKSRN